MEEYYRRPPPPVPPLWEGIYSFPGRPENLPRWLLLAFNLTMIGLCATGLHALLALLGTFSEADLMFGAGSIILRGSYYIFSGLIILSILFSLFVVNCFAWVVEDTASGV